MPTVTQILRFRRRRGQTARRSPTNIFGLKLSGLLSGAFALILAFACLWIAFEYTRLTDNLPSIETLPAMIEPPGGIFTQPSRFYDRSGQHLIFTLQDTASNERTYLRFPEQAASQGAEIEQQTNQELVLPTSVISATIAGMDPGFWSHPGFSLEGLQTGDHPTIAQRLAASLLLADESPGLRRNLRERLLAAQITERFGRQKILEWYLNSAHFGRLAYGVQAASQLYFNKPARDLNFSEAAMLVVAANDPAFSMLDFPQAALQRQKKIVQSALALRLISPEQGIEAFRSDVSLLTPAAHNPASDVSDLAAQVSPALIKLALQQLSTRIPIAEIERGGLRILTTLDYDLQTQAACAGLAQSQRMVTAQAAPSGSSDDDCPSARLLPPLPATDSALGGKPQIETFVLDPATAQILAWTGDRLPEVIESPIPTHPIGSLGTIFIYLSGFTRGLSPASLLWDVPPQTDAQVSYGSGTDPHQPVEYHGPVRLRTAFANDYLEPARAVLNQVGIENVYRISRQLGFDSPESTAFNPASGLDIFRPASLIEISHALSAFANQGTLAGRTLETTIISTAESQPHLETLPPLHPTLILRVEDLNGNTLLDWSSPQSRPILTPQLAYLISNVLSDETARWPSLGHPNPLEIGRPVAAKLGLTPDGESNWVLGYTPRRVVGVWSGPVQTDNLTTRDSQERMASATAGLWHAIMQYASQSLPYQEFDLPTGLSLLQVCDPSGLLPTVACPNVVEEIFLNGNEPVHLDNFYHMLPINQDSGRLATIFTPPDLVEERSFISVPAEAAVWAQQRGLEIPPDEYDILPAQLPSWQDTYINSPKMFTNLRGRISIQGKASGSNFSFYRLQYGKGPNPGEWYQIGQESLKPVVKSQLAAWDTTDLEDGLYSLQLLVVRDDQSAERSTILITIDNQAPQVEILSPFSGNAETGEIIQHVQRPRIVLQAGVDENLNIDQVIFKMDGRTIATFSQSPYAISWTLTPGQHTFEVIASDSAGNSGKAQTSFTVQ